MQRERNVSISRPRQVLVVWMTLMMGARAGPRLAAKITSARQQQHNNNDTNTDNKICAPAHKRTDAPTWRAYVIICSTTVSSGRDSRRPQGRLELCPCAIGTLARL